MPNSTALGLLFYCDSSYGNDEKLGHIQPSYMGYLKLTEPLGGREEIRMSSIAKHFFFNSSYSFTYAISG